MWMMAGPMEVVAEALSLFTSLAVDVGLRINLAKCELYSKGDVHCCDISQIVCPKSGHSGSTGRRQDLL